MLLKIEVGCRFLITNEILTINPNLFIPVATFTLQQKTKTFLISELVWPSSDFWIGTTDPSECFGA